MHFKLNKNYRPPAINYAYMTQHYLNKINRRSPHLTHVKRRVGVLTAFADKTSILKNYFLNVFFFERRMVDRRIDAIKFIDGFVVYHNKLASDMINVMTLNTQTTQRNRLSVIHKTI